MIRVNWQGEQISVHRVVLRSDRADQSDRSLSQLCRQSGVELGDETAEPRAGDFWVGCYPRTGWGHAHSSQIAWASQVEVPVAINALLSAEPSKSNAGRRGVPSLRAVFEDETDVPFSVAYA